MAGTDERPSATLRRLVNGYQATQALHVCAVLGLADLLADGPRGADDLAAASGAHAPSLARLLRALASLGVVRDDGDGRFALTALGEPLRADAAEPVGAWAEFVGGAPHWQAWSQLVHSVRTGETAFDAVHGMDAWAFRAHDPEAGAAFDRAMTATSRRVADTVVGAYDFGRFRVLVDVGGGAGSFLAAILRANPSQRGILFDLPGVVAGAGAVLAGAGVADRCDVVAGSFFDGVPSGGDAYTLKAVLHDWDDERAVAILRAVRAAVPADGALLVVERDLGEPNADPEPKLSDLNMLVNTGGLERTRAGYDALLAAGGFALRRAVPIGAGLQVLEGRPA